MPNKVIEGEEGSDGGFVVEDHAAEGLGGKDSQFIAVDGKVGVEVEELGIDEFGLHRGGIRVLHVVFLDVISSRGGVF